MSALVRRLGQILPTEPATPAAWCHHPAVPARVWQILGRGRLAIALDAGDLVAAGRLVDDLLADDVVGPLIASRYLSPAGRDLATTPEGTTP